jgi:glucuronate isomerase
MLYSHGFALEQLGVGVPPEQRNPREIFWTLAANWHLFLGTPSQQWMEYTLVNVFGVTRKLSAENANGIYDAIDDALKHPDFRPRALFERFNLDVLATTDGALDDLAHHNIVRKSDWAGKILPTFRPDAVLNPSRPDFAQSVKQLGEICDLDTENFDQYLEALRIRRQFFKSRGATATDHDVPDLTTDLLSDLEARKLFSRAMQDDLTKSEATRLYGHMLVQMAHMSVEDGLVMQLHVGCERSTNQTVLTAFGPDKGADIPKRVNWVSGLSGMLNSVGNNSELKIIVFTLDESSYARELAPMAGHWPALRLGPPWWFHDSLNGIERYFDQVVESAGYFNLAGFNDDTRAFMSIPARHDLWRRAVALHLEKQVSADVMDVADANVVARWLAHDAAQDAYNLRGD